jgi:sugar lactone lactonase YvrE
VLAALAAPAQAHDRGGHGDHQRISVVASGLDNPRLLSFSPTGQLYVAEAGRGGTIRCATNPELGKTCLGLTGAVTRVNPRGPDRRVVTGLPSLSGSDTLGPADVKVGRDGRYVVSVGLGGDLKWRDAFGPAGARLGTLLQGRLHHGRPWVLADIARYEKAANPDKTDVDSNPTGIFRSGRSWFFTDSGGNYAGKVSHRGRISTVAVLPPVPTTKAVTMGGQTLPVGFKADAVPTSIVRGPDGALYISQLTGFPFEKGASSIWRVAPGGGTPTKWATGLTNVTDLAFAHDGRLYAVQLSANGLLSTPQGKPPVGSLVRVTPHGSSHTTVVANLNAPYGVAFAGHTAYVSTCSVCKGSGQVLAIRF